MIGISLHKFGSFNQGWLKVIENRIILFSKENNITLSFRVRLFDPFKKEDNPIVTIYCYPKDQLKINRMLRKDGLLHSYEVEYKDRRR